MWEGGVVFDLDSLDSMRLPVPFEYGMVVMGGNPSKPLIYL